MATIIAAFLPIDLYKYAVAIINGRNLISSSPHNCITKRIIIENSEPFTALSVSTGTPNKEIKVLPITPNTTIIIKPIITIKISLGLGFLKIFDMSSLNTYTMVNNGARATINALRNSLPVGGIMNGVAAALNYLDFGEVKDS